VSQPPSTGIAVVGLEQADAAPFAIHQLADQGVRVIKIERLGEGNVARRYDEAVQRDSSCFAWLNLPEKSATLDLKHPAGRVLVAGLLRTADVFVQDSDPVPPLGSDAATPRGAEMPGQPMMAPSKQVLPQGGQADGGTLSGGQGPPGASAAGLTSGPPSPTGSQ
jgi:hypothetical protein